VAYSTLSISEQDLFVGHSSNLEGCDRSECGSIRLSMQLDVPTAGVLNGFSTGRGRLSCHETLALIIVMLKTPKQLKQLMKKLVTIGIMRYDIFDFISRMQGFDIILGLADPI
jgi:hypothetical protein